MPTSPLKIGVTGGIGSGKSVVCKIFDTLGIPIYDADSQAKIIMVENDHVVDAVRQKFGNQAYSTDGKLNREYLAEAIFKNDDKLFELNNIVHPAVAADFEKWVNFHDGKPYIIKEAALLVESGSYKTLDLLITVTAPVQVRINRVLLRDKHRTQDNVMDIISKQLGDEKKASLSRFLITNDGRGLLIPQVLKIHEFLISSKQAG